MLPLRWLLVAAVLAAGAPSRAAPEAHPFELPPSLMPNVGFWTRVYAEWNSHQVALHDLEHLDVVYRVLDLGPLEPQAGEPGAVQTAKIRAAQEAVKDAKAELSAALLALDAKRPTSGKGLSGVEKEVFLAWEKDGDPERFGRAAGQIRAQRGMSERFASGYARSGRFRGAVENALLGAGLPPGLVAMAFTESLWNLQARSVSGAVGPWQFLKGTGREYLFVNDVVDERRDPMLATLAAAKYMKQSKQRLGSWGVAITGYNYGMNGMARAVASLGTADLDVILDKYSTDRFGFAARNYYAEVLAALHVLTHVQHYFPGLQPDAPWVFDLVALPRAARSAEVVAAGVDRPALEALNPALTAEALAGKVALPRGLTLRVPPGKGDQVLAALALGKPAPEPLGQVVKVRKGETLAALARKHHLTLGELLAANALAPDTKVVVGQAITVPAPRVGFTPLPEAAPGAVKPAAVRVAYGKASELAPLAPALAGQRPAPEPILVGGPGTAVAAAAPRPAAPPPPPPALLAAVKPALERRSPLAAPAEWTSQAVQRVRRGRLQVVGGPWVAEEEREPVELDGVDILTGGADLPEVDVLAGTPGDGTPVRMLPVSARDVAVPAT